MVYKIYKNLKKMLEGSSHHHFLNLKDNKKTRNSNFDVENFSPVIERLEENSSQTNEEQKIFSKQSGIKNDELIFNNKTQLKDSVISKILFNLDNKENKGNKTLILKSKSPFKIIPKNFLEPKKSLKNYSRRNNLFNISKRTSLNEIPSFNLIKSKKNSPFNIVSPHKRNTNKRENLMAKSKRKTITFSGVKKSSSQLLNNAIKIKNLQRISVVQHPIDINKKETYNEKTKNKDERNSYLQSTETNQKLLSGYTNPKKKISGITIDNSKLSEDYRFSSLIKKNKIQMVKGFFLKNSRQNVQKNENYIESILNDPNIRKKDVLLKRVKIYSFIQSITSLISILLNIIDLELYNKYSNDYIIENNIEFKNYYEIKNREINSNENIVRILNGIFSFTCLLMTIFIFISKYNFNKKENEKLLNRRNKNLGFIHDINNNKQKISKISKQDQISKLLFVTMISVIQCHPSKKL